MARTSRSLLLPEAAAGTGSAAAVDGRARWQLTFASAAVLLAAADTYVVVLALTSIMTDIGINIDRLQEAAPIISGFLLGYVVVLPLLGRLSDLYGRRPVFIGSLLLFASGSLITAAAHGLTAVVVGRTIQGLGGGGLVPVTLALVADMWPPGRRGLPLGVVGAVQELGSVLGPLYGAALIALSSWRTIFWLNLPVALALGIAFAIAQPGRPAAAAGGGGQEAAVSRRRLPDIVGGLLLVLAAAAGALVLLQPDWLANSVTLGQLYDPQLGAGVLTCWLALTGYAAALLFIIWELAAPPSRVRLWLPLRRLPEALTAVDWLGAALIGVVLGCVILAFSAADPGTQTVAANAVVTLPLAGVCALAFVAWQLRARRPLVDLRALRSRPAAGALLANVAVGGALMAALVDVPIFARATVFPDSQLRAALVLVRLLVAVPIGAVLGGLLCERLGYRVVAGAGMVLSAVSFVFMAGWSETALSDHWQPGFGLPLGWSDVELLAAGLGFGLVIAPVNAALLGAVSQAVHGVASALLVVARMVGMLVGLALLTAIGLRRFFDAQSHIPSPIDLCPRNPAVCPAYNHLETLAAIDELHVIFAGAAVCAALAAVIAVASLTRRRGERAGRVGLAELLAG